MIGSITGYNQNYFSTSNMENLQSRKGQDFSDIDTDESGTVSKDEFQVLMDEINPETGFVADVDAIV